MTHSFNLLKGPKSADREIRLGLLENWPQFALLVALNLFVGGMIGLERTILPVLAESEFGIESKTAAISFIATFGIAKALSNLFAGSLTQRMTRRRILITGWLFGLPVPIILILAPNWGWVIGANLLLGINQGLAWSMTVNMKMDLVGPRWRGLALGFNETAGYVSLAVAAFLTGIIAQSYGLRPEPFYLGIGIAAGGLAISVFLVCDTAPYLAMETARQAAENPTAVSVPVSLRRSFAETTWRRRDLFGITQAGLVKNLNDGLAWGIFPIFFASYGLDLDRIGILVAIYPIVWGSLQIASGWISDVVGRSPLIITGMLLQGCAICLTGLFTSFGPWAGAMVLLGLGTALVYPTLLAAIGDAVPARERAASLGVYRGRVPILAGRRVRCRGPVRWGHRRPVRPASSHIFGGRFDDNVRTRGILYPPRPPRVAPGLGNATIFVDGSEAASAQTRG